MVKALLGDKDNCQKRKRAYVIAKINCWKLQKLIFEIVEQLLKKVSGLEKVRIVVTGVVTTWLKMVFKKEGVKIYDQVSTCTINNSEDTQPYVTIIE